MSPAETIANLETALRDATSLLADLRTATAAPTPDRSEINSAINQFKNEVVEIVREELAAVSSPWMTRERAARYIGHHPSKIDQFANEGKLKRHWSTPGSPRFYKDDLDALMDEEMPKTRRGRKAQTQAAA